MSYKSDVWNWVKGGQTSKETKVQIAVTSIGVILVILSAYTIHPGLAGMVFGLFLAVPKKDE